MNDLMAGKTVVITGASTGIGRAALELLCAQGASVVASARTPGPLREAVDGVVADGGKAVAIAADMSDDAQVGRVIDAATTEFGGLDVLVNNAGVGYGYRSRRPHSMLPIAEAPLDDWDHVMGINLGSVVYASRRAIPVMAAGGGGSIVNIASILGLVGHHDAHAYTTAKGAIVNLTRSCAMTYGKDQIRTNVICPGYIDTQMIAEYVGYLNSDDYRFQWNPMGRTGTPREIADAILYLSSDMSSYVNGSVLVVDGGFTAK